MTKYIINLWVAVFLLAACNENKIITQRASSRSSDFSNLQIAPQELHSTDAGGESHGTDLEQDQENPWFLGEAPISYCVESIDANANATQISEYVDLVKESFSEWKTFFEKYGLNTLLWGHIKPYPKYADFHDGIPRGLSLESQYIKACNDPTTQLRIVFVADRLLSQSPLQAYSLGAAIRGKYDHTNYRTGGTVWVRVMEEISVHITKKAQLKSVLVHELGHVFAMPHNSVFAMREATAKDITHPDFDIAPYLEYLGQIESPYWKYKLKPLDTLEINYTYGSTQQPDYKGYMPEIFKKGFESSTSRFSSTLTYLGQSNSRKKQFALTVDDQFGHSNTFKGEFDDAVGASVSSHQDKAYVGVSLFTPWCLWGNKPPNCSSFRIFLEEQPGGEKRDYAFAIPAFGTLDAAEVKIPVAIEKSNNGGAVVKVFLPETNDWFFFSVTGPRKKGTNRWDW